MASLFIWIKVLHVIGVISWMAGLLYLPRLFIYHCNHIDNETISQTFKTMEQRLLKFIMRPAMGVTWITGLFMAYYGQFYFETWFLVKFSMVILLTVVHGYLAGVTEDFRMDRNSKSARFFRFLNEAPTLLMIVIVAMVIAKPF